MTCTISFPGRELSLTEKLGGSENSVNGLSAQFFIVRVVLPVVVELPVRCSGKRRRLLILAIRFQLSFSTIEFPCCIPTATHPRSPSITSLGSQPPPPFCAITFT